MTIKTPHYYCDNTYDIDNCVMFQAGMLDVDQLHDP